MRDHNTGTEYAVRPALLLQVLAARVAFHRWVKAADGTDKRRFEDETADQLLERHGICWPSEEWYAYERESRRLMHDALGTQFKCRTSRKARGRVA